MSSEVLLGWLGIDGQPIEMSGGGWERPLLYSELKEANNDDDDE